MGLGSGRVGRFAVIAASVLLTALALPADAPAKHGLVTGFVDADGLYESADPVERATWLDRTVDSGAGIVRLHVFWGAVAGPQPPPDPSNSASASYNFAGIDLAVRGAEARGLGVLLTVTGAPAWAEAPGRPAAALPGTWKPSPSDLADFMRAVAARYSGGFDPDGPGPAPPIPAVQALQVWNEPNIYTNLTPQYEGQTAFSPAHYREMLNAAYSAVKAVDPRMLVVTAGTAPYGDPPGGNRMRPVTFWREALCASPAKKKKRKHKKKRHAAKRRVVEAGGCQAKFDVLAHHPINTSGGPQRHALNPNDASSADLDRIVRVLRAAERAGTVLPGRHPIWATEMWWDSNPPNSAGAPLGRHARWIEQALYLLWKAGASVVLNLQIRDATTGPLDARGGAQSGVFFADGQAKPAFQAFRFPFVTERNHNGVLRAWGKAPAGGAIQIQRRRSGWRTIKTIKVAPGAVFTARLASGRGGSFRAVLGAETSLVWHQGKR